MSKLHKKADTKAKKLLEQAFVKRLFLTQITSLSRSFNAFPNKRESRQTVKINQLRLN